MNFRYLFIIIILIVFYFYISYNSKYCLISKCKELFNQKTKLKSTKSISTKSKSAKTKDKSTKHKTKLKSAKTKSTKTKSFSEIPPKCSPINIKQKSKTISNHSPIRIQKQKLSDILNGEFTELDRHCGHVSDVGYVCPLNYNDNDNNIMIKPFQEISEDIQMEVAEHIFNEWGIDLEKNDPTETLEFIKSNWFIPNYFYVMLNYDNEFIGCIGIDRHNFYPCISHLYVVSKFRGLNYSQILMRFAEKIIKKLNISEIYLWCHTHLQGFYEKQGYSIKSETTKNDIPNLIMNKFI